LNMISLAPFVLTTPLLKVPLLVTNSMLTYYGMTPPRQPPPTKEQLRFTVPDLMTRTTRIQMAATAASKYVLCGVAIAEAIVLVVRDIPLSYSGLVLDALLPAAGNSAQAAASLNITTLSAAGCILGIAGGLIRVWCHRALGKFFTWQMAVRDDHELITRGPYSIVRHPSYTGWIFIISGNFLSFASPGSYFIESGLRDSILGRIVALASFGYCLFSTVNLIGRVAKEDAVLKKEFQAQWDTWAKQTPYRLIPFVY
ncbi:hypothetical protein BD311DRAFT_839669, partial [Dichomitus squalens]